MCPMRATFHNIGMSPSGKAPDFDSGIRRFKSGHPSQKKARASVFFSVIFACGEFYCFAVIFGLRRVIFASRVWVANIISLKPKASIALLKIHPKFASQMDFCLIILHFLTESAVNAYSY